MRLVNHHKKYLLKANLSIQFLSVHKVLVPVKSKISVHCIKRYAMSDQIEIIWSVGAVITAHFNYDLEYD